MADLPEVHPEEKLRRFGVNEEYQIVNESEIEKATKLLEESGYVVVNQLSLVARPYIRELCDVLDAAGYRLDEVKLEHSPAGRATESLVLVVYLFKVLEREGKPNYGESTVV
jgi:hypothetical protein